MFKRAAWRSHGGEGDGGDDGDGDVVGVVGDGDVVGDGGVVGDGDGDGGGGGVRALLARVVRGGLLVSMAWAASRRAV